MIIFVFSILITYSKPLCCFDIAGFISASRWQSWMWIYQVPLNNKQSVYFGQFDPFTKFVQPSKTFYSYFLPISFVLSTGYQSICQQSLPLSTQDTGHIYSTACSGDISSVNALATVQYIVYV